MPGERLTLYLCSVLLALNVCQLANDLAVSFRRDDMYLVEASAHAITSLARGEHTNLHRPVLSSVRSQSGFLVPFNVHG